MREIKYQTETLNADIACKPLNSASFGGGGRVYRVTPGRTRRPFSRKAPRSFPQGWKKRTWVSRSRVMRCWVLEGKEDQGSWERQRICFKKRPPGHRGGEV